jgi:hypothetical protein
MRQTGPYNWQAKRRMVAVAVFIAIAGLLFISERASSTVVGEPQRRQKRPGAPPSEKVADKYSKFTHESHGNNSRDARAQKLKCNNCHAIPSAAEPDRIADAKSPRIVRGYPYHDACFDCHRKEIYRGDRPAICTVCHTRVSPRATADDVVRQFPKQIDLTLRQFPGSFPHEKHSQVISDLEKVTDSKQVSCVDCHKRDERSPVPIPVSGDEKIFTPAAGTFRTSPDLPNNPPSAHTSCFGCHWETNDETKKPSKDNCAGCHRTPKEFAEQKQPKKESLVLLMSVLWFKDWPRDWPRRLSLKFSHESKNHRGADNPGLTCTSCHASIGRSEKLEIPDVTLSKSTCAQSGCHFERTSVTSIRKEMNDEGDDIAEGRNNDPLSSSGQHTCTGCHTSLIGSAPPPCSHYRLFGDKYWSIEDYPKSAKQIAERCKK